MFEILTITGPIYLTIGIGFLVTRCGLFNKDDMRVLGKFVLNMALPALLFNALAQRPLREIIHTDYLLAYALGSLVVLLCALLWARLVAHRSGSFSSYFAMGMSCSNSGFVGYPVLVLTVGGAVAGVALALNMIVENLFLLPLLMTLAETDGDATPGRQSLGVVFGQRLKGLLKNPLIIAIVAGLIFSALGVQLPGVLARTVTLFSQASAALALFVIGGTLVGLQVKGMRRPVAQIAVGKLIFHPLAVLLVIWMLPISDPQLRMALLITAAMPMAGIYPLLAQRHGHQEVSAAALLVTTVGSFLTLSTLLLALKHSVFLN